MDFDPRQSLFAFGLVVILLALLSALLFSKETIHWARAESAAHKAGTHEGPRAEVPNRCLRAPFDSWRFSSWFRSSIGLLRHLSQAGCVEKFVDALVWVFFPVFLFSKGLTLVQIGWVVGIYGFVWGGSQLWTGPLSDAFGRKWPIVIGMWTCAIGNRGDTDGRRHGCVVTSRPQLIGSGDGAAVPTLDCGGRRYLSSELARFQPRRVSLLARPSATALAHCCWA